MTPDPNSPIFIKHEVPEHASDEAKVLAKVFSFIKNEARENKWHGITEDDVSLGYNTQTSLLTIEVRYTDPIGILHKCFIKHLDGDLGYIKTNLVWCEYLFEGGDNLGYAMVIKSFAELIMLKLWKEKLDAELEKCDRGLRIKASMNNVYPIFCKLLGIVTANNKPKEWYCDGEPVWLFRQTHGFISKLSGPVKAEANSNRWKDIEGCNFYIMRCENYAYLCLDYLKEDEYEQRIRIGLDSDSFAYPEKHVECNYEFEILTKDQELRDYLERQHREFIAFVNNILGIVFTHNALFIRGEEDFKIVLLKSFAFQKICLLLDIFLPLKDGYPVSEPFMSSNLHNAIAQLEKTLGGELKVENRSEKLFAGGHFKKVVERFDENMDMSF